MRNPLSVAVVMAMGFMTTAFARDPESTAIERAGLDPALYAIGTTSMVSVRAPWTEAARVAFADVDLFNTDGNLARLGPGRDETTPIPRAQLFWNADAASAYVVDCLVTGDAQAFLTSRFEGGRERENRHDMPVTRNGDRVAFFMDKGTGGNAYLQADMAWAFKECAIITLVER